MAISKLYKIIIHGSAHKWICYLNKDSVQMLSTEDSKKCAIWIHEDSRKVLGLFNNEDMQENAIY